MSVVIGILTSSIATAACLIYASVGEIIGERCGVINLGLEGVMTVGAVIAYAVAYNTGSLGLAVIGALIAGMIVGLIFAFLSVTLRANQIVCGLAFVTFGSGLGGFIGKTFIGTTLPVKFTKLSIPVLSKIPVIGPIFFNQDILVYFLYFLVPAVCFYIYKTGPGLKLRALGENPGALDAAGVPVLRYRYLYVMLANTIVSLGGAYITLASIPTWSENLVAGNGWIAAALVIFSFWNPAFAALGALFFGLVNVLSIRLQLSTIPIPSFFMSMLPYICTILVLVLSAAGFGKKLSTAPKALRQPYDREAR